MNPNGRIIPSAGQPTGAVFIDVYGLKLQVFLDVDPAQYPEGVDVVCTPTGKLEPLKPGKIVLGKGSMLVLVPLEVAAHFRRELHAAIEKAKRAAALKPSAANPGVLPN